MYKGKGNWQFVFNISEGMEMFMSWIARLQRSIVLVLRQEASE